MQTKQLSPAPASAPLELQLPGGRVRVAIADAGGQPLWLVAADVAAALGSVVDGMRFARGIPQGGLLTAETPPLTAHQPAQATLPVQTTSGTQDMVCINMAALHALAARSRTEAGRALHAYLVAAATRALTAVEQPAAPAQYYLPLPGSMPPGMSWDQLAAQAMEEIRRWEARGTGQPISGWRLGPILGVHQAVVERALDDAVARGDVHARPSGTGGTTYSLQPLPQQEKPAPAKKQDTPADKAKALEERILKVLREARGPVSARALCDAVGGRRASALETVRRLAARGGLTGGRGGWLLVRGDA